MVPDEKVFARFPGDGSKTLPALAEALLGQQKQAWPACAKGHAALDQAEIRTLNANGMPVRLHWNPQRIVSTSAKVDPSSIKARRCFLCVENLPQEQQGILYRDEYLVLCNPAPIFRTHFTVTHVTHRPQQVLDGLELMLSLARDLGGSYVTFYNGPKCGASAPDHLHFQAVGTGSIPAENDVKGATKKDRLVERDGILFWKVPFYGRTHCVLSGTDPEALAAAFRRFIGAWKAVAGSDEEPMLNLLSVVHDGEVSLLVFLRSKHRPDDYFKEAEEQVMVSPASVDIGGHIVTPVEKDFHAIDGQYIERMYNEVSVPPAMLMDIIHAI